jgi:homogentisate 1,2-dioxygenase
MMRSWIHFTRGRFVRQARVGLGDLREEHLSRKGFLGPVAMLYRTDGPNEVVRVEGEYRSRQADSADVVAPDRDDPRGGWLTLLANDECAVAVSRRTQAMPFCYRDMVGDLLYFVHRGRGVFATEFGPIPYEPGDYVLLPKATTFRLMPEPGDSLFLVVESPEPIRPSEHENVGRHTPFDPTTLTVPDVVDYGFPAQSEYEVRIRHGRLQGGGHSAVFYKNDPLKVVGWKGDLFPFKLNVRDIRPIMSDRIHLAPSSWATFETPGFAILSFVPQIAVSDLEAEELPSYHRNIDMDEFMLVHADEDQDGRRPGQLMHTPQGILHGANEAFRAEFQKRRQPGQRRGRTMIGVDTYRPLTPTAEFVRLAGG